LRKKQPASTVRGSGASSNEVLNFIAIRILFVFGFPFLFACVFVCVCVCLSLSLPPSLPPPLSLSVWFFLFDLVLLLFLLNSWSIPLETGSLVRVPERGFRRGGFAVFFYARKGVEKLGRETETCFSSSQVERQLQRDRERRTRAANVVIQCIA
jgi:hypothetical protein